MAVDVETRIIEIIAEQAVVAPQDVSLDASLETLGLDSLGLVEMIFSIEESFDIAVPFNANETVQNEFDISSVGAISAAVKQMIAEQSGRN